MAQQIIIEGDLVRVVNITNERSVTLQDWLPSIERRVAVYTPVLPRATRALWFDPTETNNIRMTILLEVEPQVIHLSKSGSIHQIMIPWTRFVFYCTNHYGLDSNNWRMDDYRVFWSKNRYNDPNATDCIRALLPNVYNDGRICFGSTGADANQSIANRLDQTVNEFFSSEFNNDLGVAYPNEWRGYRAWVAATAKDPMGWMSWPDLGPDQTNWTKYSWNSIIGEWNTVPTRDIPVAVPDPIPPLALNASFGRIEQWLDSLTPAQRIRIDRALELRPADVAVEPETTEDDEI